MARQPALFISHGSPMILLDDCPARHFMAEYGAALPRPDAVLMISAHWETFGVAVATTDAPETIHDFYGFPAPLYQFRYAAPGAPGIATRAAECLMAAELPVMGDARQGLDHGAWVPLAYMFPNADIPVAQVSIQPHLGPAHHLALGRALAPLRDENVLIVCSGNVTHGRRAGDVDMEPLDWVTAFSDWVDAAVADGRADDLVAYRRLAPFANENHPTEDHYVPLLIAMGAGGAEGRAERLHASYTYGTISMNSYAFH
jgi:4,5-DOPA dioxygenase extradiol